MNTSKQKNNISKKSKPKAKSSEIELIALKKAVETMQIGVTVSDVNGIILYANPADAHMHGYSVEDLIGKEASVYALPQYNKPRSMESLMKTTSWSRETVNIRSDGTQFPVHLMSDVVKTADGTPIAIVTACEDITRRKKAEDQLRWQVDKLKILRQVDASILSSVDFNVVLDVLLDELTKNLGIEGVLVMTYNPETLSLKYCAGRGFDSAKISKIEFRAGVGLSGRIAVERKTVHIADLRDSDIHEDVLKHYLGDRAVSYYGFPLNARGQLMGTIEVFDSAGRKSGKDLIEFMESASAHIAIAIDNSSMFDDLQRSNMELKVAYDSTLDGWSKAMDLRDKETEGHSQRVAALTIKLARLFGIPESEIVHIRRGALLHDIGKMGIPDCILLKPAGLSEEEWEIMKLHPVHAYNMLSRIDFLKPAIDIPHSHHERWDGTGYPKGLKGLGIPLSARIFAVVDNWDALSSDRPYRKAWPEEKVREYLQELSGSHFDPTVVAVFLEMI